MIQMMATLLILFLLACLFDLLVGKTAIDETRYVKAGTDVKLSCPINGTVLRASWYYYEHHDKDTGNSIYIAAKYVIDTSYPRIDRITVVYDTNNGVYDLTLLNFNGQTDVGQYICYTSIQNSGYFYSYFTVELADGPSTASITGNVPVFADFSSSLTLTCVATATPGVTFMWINGNTRIGYNSTLTWTPVRADNGVAITCIAINRQFDDIRASASVILQVHYGPKSVIITGNPVYADGRNRLTLTCRAEEYSPDVEFQWKEGSQSINAQNTNIYTKIADKTDNGRTLTCLTWNTLYTNTRKETSTELIVYYGPESADIIGTSTVYADDVNTLTFTCTAAASYPGVSFQWTKGGISIGDNSDTLTFTPVPTDDGEDVVCIATNTAHQNGQARNSVALIVYYGPKSVIITGVPVYADGTNRLTLTCTAEEYSPDIEFQWKEGSQHINGQNTNTYTKIADKIDNGRTLTCLTWNTLYTNKRKETSTQLIVYYGPHNTDILISVLNPREGGDVTVLCICDCNPAPSFTITGPAGDTHSQNRLYLENIFRADSGTYACTAGNKYGTQTKAIAILVNYAPEITVTTPDVVSEGEKGVELLCEAKGIPDSYNFGIWRHLGPTDYIEVRKLEGAHTVNQSSLVFDKPLTYEDSGHYECNVNNGVSDQAGKLDQSDRKYLQVTGVPLFLEDKDTTFGEIGQNVKVEVSFYSVPEYTDVMWFTLSSSGQQIVADRSPNIEQTITQRILDTTYHGVDVAVNGYTAALVFKNMTVENTGSYNVVIANEKGQTNYLKKLDIKTDDLKTEEITAAVAGSVSVLLIIICIVVVVLCRRGVITKPNSSCLKDNENYGQDVYQNQAFDPISAVGSSTNEAIYQEIGPSENPAMHYESVTH